MDIGSIKCVAIGDQNAGKTWMLHSYTGEHKINPNLLEALGERQIEVDGKHVKIILWDTIGRTDCDQTRPLCYKGTDVFLLCFSVVNLSTFSSIQTKWFPEVRHFCPSTPILLVGTQIDLREIGSNDPSTITAKQGRTLAKEISAVGYFECSAITGEGLDTVFDEACRSTQTQSRKRNCHIL